MSYYNCIGHRVNGSSTTVQNLQHGHNIHPLKENYHCYIYDVLLAKGEHYNQALGTDSKIINLN
jgi:hypothetical protein